MSSHYLNCHNIDIKVKLITHLLMKQDKILPYLDYNEERE